MGEPIIMKRTVLKSIEKMDDVTFSINQLIFSIIQLANSKDLKLTIMTHSLYNSTLIKFFF